MPSIDCVSSQPISAFSGFPKLRQSVKPSGSPGAGDIAGGLEDCERAAGEGIQRPDPAGSVESHGEPAIGRPQP